MPVSTRQACYEERMPQWLRCREAVAGVDRIKEAGERYLPRLSGQGVVPVQAPGVPTMFIDEYESYKTRANWYNDSKTAVKEIVGALFRVPPQWRVPEAIKSHLHDITLAGESADMFVQRLATELAIVSFAGVLVDLPTDGGSLPRPYWTLYQAEQIIRIRRVPIDGVWVFGQVVLEEHTYEPDPDDPFADIEVVRYRVLELDTQGYLIHRPFVMVKGKAQEEETLYPSIRGQRIRGIPFECFGATSLLAEPIVPLILDLVDINLSHYRTSADLEEALHKLAVPTPYAAGFETELEMRLGANVCYQTPNPQAKIAFAEFTGSGLNELRESLRHKEEQMEAMRARLMARMKTGVESAEAIRLRFSGTENVLMTLAHSMSEGLMQLLQHHLQMMRVTSLEDCTCHINDDFLDNTLSPQEMEQNRKDYEARLISYKTWWWRSKKGELLPPETTPEIEKAEMHAEQPMLEDRVDLPADEDEAPETEEAA